jgi:hypothetical protein
LVTHASGKGDGFSRLRETRGEAAAAQTPKGVTLTRACNAAADELKASRRLIEVLESENALLKERLETEKKTSALLAELNETRKSEGDALRNAIAAKNETLLAKDAVIASQDKLIETLKTKKSSPWKRFGDILIGVAAGMVLR